VADSISVPAFATGVGLVLWGMKKRSGAEMLQETSRRGGKASLAVGRKFGGWLREFLP
jgi:hypothetical protein